MIAMTTKSSIIVNPRRRRDEIAAVNLIGSPSTAQMDGRASSCNHISLNQIHSFD